MANSIILKIFLISVSCDIQYPYSLENYTIFDTMFLFLKFPQNSNLYEYKSK